MRLVECVENGRFRVLAHTRGAHLVVGVSGKRNVGSWPHIAKSRCFEHFCSSSRHVIVHRHLILAESAVDFQYRPSPLVCFAPVQNDAVVGMRKAFPVALQRKVPRAWLRCRFLQRLADPERGCVRPSAPSSSALHAVAANKIRSLFFDIPEAWHINLIWALAIVVFVLETFHAR